MIEIPEFLKHLRVDKERKFPIPFFTAIRDGKPDFRYLDEKKQILCMEKNLCGICGKKLHKDYHYFISGIGGMTNQVSSDPPMHRECAEYALRVCPHMFYKTVERKTDESEFTDDVHAYEKPDTFYLIKSSKCRLKFEPRAGHCLIHYTMVSYDAYGYEDNKLKKL